MPKAHLTDISIRSLKAPARGQITYWDTTFPTFGIRVSQGGTKSFTILNGKDRRRITIGRYPAISLSQARSEAKRLLAEITLGKDRPPTISFGEALDLFLTTHCKQRNKPRTAKETERLLRKHFLPKLRRFALEEITTHQITSIVDRLLPTPSEACHAFTAVRTFFRWCTRRRYIPHSPCEGLQLPAQPNSRERVLSDQELVHVIRACELYGWPCGNIFFLLLLTGQRRGEISSLQWNHVDLDQRLITFPSALTKNNRQHTFPYGDMAARIIESIPKSGDLLFPARGNSDKTFSGWSKGKIKLDRIIAHGGVEISPWTLHDLRRTFATNLAALGTPIQVTEKLLNHVSGTVSGVAAIYNRHTYMDEMHEAIDAWDAKLAQLLEDHPPET